MLGYYQTLGRALQIAFPELQWIDLDKGQLDNPEKYHTIRTPAVLIGLKPVTWKDLSQGAQLGESTLTLTLIVPRANDTFIGAPALDDYTDLQKRLYWFARTYKGVTGRIETDAGPKGVWYSIKETYRIQAQEKPTLKTVPVTPSAETILKTTNQ